MESRLVKSIENRCNVDLLACVNGFLFFIIHLDEVNVALCPEISLDPEKGFSTL